MSFEAGYTEVLIIGGGPIGLLTAYALQKMGVSTCIIERLDKDKMPMYGRACTLFPRTLEFLDQLDLLDELTQEGFIARTSINYKDGKQVNGRGWQQILSRMDGTHLDFCLNLRLKYSERIIQNAYEGLHGQVAVGWELRDLSTGPETTDGYKVSAVVGAVGSDEVRTLKSKYIIGADGGSSTVRRLSGIQFPTDRTTHRWIRIDGLVETDMPNSRIGWASIESKTHGNVLWVALDHGRTRIGFSLNPELYKKYGDKMTEAQVVQEAKAAVAPFSLSFKAVDWYTVYSIQQGVAGKYFIDDSVILAGDACHTHSSAAAQGMNAGIHDAINLAWKLGGVICGYYNKTILQTYEDERRPVAEELIRQDKQLSSLISGIIPDACKVSGLTSDELFTNTVASNAQFALGLGVYYNENQLNASPSTTSLVAGWRAPDVLLRRPGSCLPVRLQQLTPNTGAFWVVVFAGEPLLTRNNLIALRSHLDSPESFMKRAHPDAIHFLTIISGVKSQGEVALGVKRFGNVYYDADNSAHSKYGITEGSGGVVVLRPDGILGFAAQLTRGEDLTSYFSDFILCTHLERR